MKGDLPVGVGARESFEAAVRPEDLDTVDPNRASEAEMYARVATGLVAGAGEHEPEETPVSPDEIAALRADGVV